MSARVLLSVCVWWSTRALAALHLQIFIRSIASVNEYRIRRTRTYSNSLWQILLFLVFSSLIWFGLNHSISVHSFLMTSFLALLTSCYFCFFLFVLFWWWFGIRSLEIFCVSNKYAMLVDTSCWHVPSITWSVVLAETVFPMSVPIPNCRWIVFSSLLSLHM